MRSQYRLLQTPAKKTLTIEFYAQQTWTKLSVFRIVRSATRAINKQSTWLFTEAVPVTAIGVTSHGALAGAPGACSYTPIWQFLLIRTTPVGSGRLPVNTSHISQPQIQSRLTPVYYIYTYVKISVISTRFRGHERRALTSAKSWWRH